MDLKNKVAVVTGAGRGMGKVIAESLAAEGCKLVVVSRTESQVREVERGITTGGGECLSLVLDLADRRSAARVIPAALERFGSLDILVNNAGVLTGTPLLEVTADEWDHVLAVNLTAAFILSQAALREMAKRKSGYIINISSTAALQVPAHLTTYGTSKKALLGFTEALYENAKPLGVKVSVILPGMTDTEMLRNANPPVPRGHWMGPHDIAGCVLFLLRQSDKVVVREIVPWATLHDEI
jgi:NAD(P)-dependent dehydrogenase (short-subunit alcohol dehydrogenase family)